MENTESTCEIHLYKEQKSITCASNHSILEATTSAGINHMQACGGRGKCSTCRVCISDGLENCEPRNEAEQKIADKLDFPPEIRLACQTKIKGSISIRRIVIDDLDIEIANDQFRYNADLALGRQKKLTIVFTDIVNYTNLAEKFPAYDVVHVLNRYYRVMNSVIENQHGFISDIAGDGILAVFGKEDDRENSVLDAVKAVNDMNKALVSFNEYIMENYGAEFGIRAGIHFGKVIIGPYHIGVMKKLGVIGDNVNYASRIETANKDFGTNLLLSEEAYEMVKDIYPNHQCHETSLKGKTGCYKLYEILNR